MQAVHGVPAGICWSMWSAQQKHADCAVIGSPGFFLCVMHPAFAGHARDLAGQLAGQKAGFDQERQDLHGGIRRQQQLALDATEQAEQLTLQLQHNSYISDELKVRVQGYLS